MLFIIVTLTSGCKSAKDKDSTEIQPEHRYEIELENRKVVDSIIRDFIPEDEICKGEKGFIKIFITLNENGKVKNIDDYEFNKVIIPQGKVKEFLKELSSEMRYSISDNALNYYAILHKQIEVVFIASMNQFCEQRSSSGSN